MRLGIFVSHPIQYYAPLFRELASRMRVHVFYGQQASTNHQANSGFGVGFEWDVDLTSGYIWSVLENRSSAPSVDTFHGCDSPSIYKELQDKKVDAVLITGWYQKFLVQAAVAAKRLRLPLMVRGDSQLNMSASMLKRAMKKATYPFALRTFDAALYVGRRSCSYYKHFGYPEERLFFSPHCVDTSWFAARSSDSARAERRSLLGLAPDTKVVLFAGKLVQFKRPVDVVRSTAQIRANGLRAEVVIAGAGPLAAQVAAEAYTLGVPLHSLGFCNQSVMPSVYAAADVLALPSTGRETWGLVCNEALASGTPIVVSNEVGCAPDLARDNHAGRQHRVADTDSLAQALARSLSHPPTRQQIAAISSQYAVSRAVDGVEAAMKDICAPTVSGPLIRTSR